MRTVTEKLQEVVAERDNLLLDNEISCQTSKEELERLRCRVTSVSNERDQIQETLEGLREENHHLQAELEDSMGSYRSEVCCRSEPVAVLKSSVIPGQSRVYNPRISTVPSYMFYRSPPSSRG